MLSMRQDGREKNTIAALGDMLAGCVDPNLPLIGREQQLLSTMHELERSRLLFGPFCRTIGQGPQRSMVLRSARSIDRLSSLRFPSDPGVEYGPLRTTYTERVFLNAAGVFVAATVTDQRLDYDPSQRAAVAPYAVAQRLRQVGEIQSRSAAHVALAGRQAESWLRAIIEDGEYPAPPEPSLDSAGLLDARCWAWLDQHGRHEIGRVVLSPEGKLWQTGPLLVPTEVDFEARVAGGFQTTPAVLAYRVTWADLAIQALQSSIELIRRGRAATSDGAPADEPLLAA